jgi:hypothetical protein
MKGDKMPESEIATAEEVRLARDIHATEEIQIADNTKIQRVEGGYWVQGWLWVSDESRAISAFGGLQ